MLPPNVIAAFLSNHPPFENLDTGTLIKISDASRVVHYPIGHRFFKKNETGGDSLFVVYKGAVDILSEEGGTTFILDRCDEGDLFGARPLLAKSPYLAEAVAHEECSIIELPFLILRPLLEENAQLALFFAASYASGQRNPADRSNPGVLIGKNNNQSVQLGLGLAEIQIVQPSRALVSIEKNTTIQAAAQKMHSKSVGSVLIVNAENQPIGIITDRDLRNRVIAKGLDISSQVSHIMSSPVRTIKPDPSIAEVQSMMFQKFVRHICITTDGTDKGSALGVLSQQDLLIAQGSSPATLIRQMRKAERPAQLRLLRERAESVLRTYLEKDVSIEYISQILTSINEALIIRVIELALKDLKSEEGLELDANNFCWLGLGSEGRQEQLLRTDQDNALVFIEKKGLSLETQRQTYLVFARKVTTTLDTCGFVFCPGDMMASNPKWCLSLKEWNAKFSDWINNPSPESVLNTSILFDFRSLFGNVDLSLKMTTHIFEELGKKEIFLSFLAKDALKSPPPVGFFRNILLERNGKHKNQFDIKGRAMLPLADAARVLVLHKRISEVNNTPARFRALSEVEPQNAELFIQAAESYEVLMRFRAEHGLKNKDTGRFLELESLTKMERMTLKNCFDPINDLQKLMTTRFQLAFF